MPAPDGSVPRPDRPPQQRPPADEPAVQGNPRCRRCGSPVVDSEREPFHRVTGLCYWCAYVDTHG